jgi:transcriptional regulator with XRE-family HTH domain
MKSHFNFGKALRLAQVKKGVSSTQLASNLGVTKQQLSYWRYKEDGRISVALRLCDMLEIDFTEFLDIK